MLLPLCVLFLNTVTLAMEPDMRIVQGHWTDITNRPFQNKLDIVFLRNYEDASESSLVYPGSILILTLTIVGRILSCRVADKHPQVAIQVNYLIGDPEFIKLAHRCGGSIISKRSILTAAHCVNNFQVQDLFITVGSTDLGDEFEFPYALQTFVSHPEFGKDPSRWGCDIAILTTKEDITFSETVQPIKLSTKSPLPSTRAIVSGYGMTRKPERDGLAPRLAEVTVTTLDQDLCKRLLSERKKTVDKSQFCAADLVDYGDACQGDSGGPLTIGDELVGIVSWGVGCGVPNLPGMYTDVYQFLDWIKQNMGDAPVVLSGRRSVPITVRPFHVTLYIRAGILMPWCGGSIISKRSVLTAAHCLWDKTAQDLLIRVGSENLEEQISEDGHWYTVMKYIIHENFNTDPYTKWSNDIGVLITVTDFKFGPSVQPIPLSTVSPADTQKVYISSHILTHPAISKQANVLIVQELQKWNHGYCQQLLTRITALFPVVISTQFCGVDPSPSQDGRCILDGGDPITTETTGGHLVGIASWEPGCANRGALTIHTDVVSFADWIVANTQEVI